MNTSKSKSKQVIIIWNAITKFIINLHSFFPINIIFGYNYKLQTL